MKLLKVYLLAGALAAGMNVYAQSAQKTPAAPSTAGKAAAKTASAAAAPAPAAQLTAAQLPKGDAARGKAAFAQCQLCHDPDAWRTGGLLARKGGPPLRRLYSKSKLATTGKPVNDDTVLEVINNGGKGMVPFKDILNAQQKADLIAYIKGQ